MKTSLALNSFAGLLLLFLFSGQLPAQTALGLKAGLTASNSQVKFQSSIASEKPDNDPRFSAHFGYLLRTYLSDRFYFQPELLYIEKGFRGRSVNATGAESTTVVRFRNISLPLLLGVQFGNFQIAAGPEITYFLKAHTKSEGGEFAENPFFGKNEWLFNGNLELAYQINSFQLSLRGSLGLKPFLKGNLTDVNGVTAGSFTYYNQALQAAIAYMIFQ
ncbi:porin family protein [Flavilitoribacter nigricans]|uniref:Outer membrane protein beta-barrel domain-containing protein n=1 Tax=Flavilitoribacter nigricans (strain ATCC 23147 / DSM 23189 / NBRC 102662 / NCIMB 1420 / SS-2) TaxID=1122177 RepID=A0A2D0N8C0_FLAN2|nr:porin family protein [Flavilitoribacter nigricans]PHN04727.1 hypothetical protein CRP01_19625 [Flavilitoribacter nigricans DSM 23189 = NBRC 102662]